MASRQTWPSGSFPGYTELEQLASGGFGDVVPARHDAQALLGAIKNPSRELLADARFAEICVVSVAVDEPGRGQVRVKILSGGHPASYVRPGWWSQHPLTALWKRQIILSSSPLGAGRLALREGQATGESSE